MSRHEYLTNKAETLGTSDLVTEAATHMMWGHGAYDMIIMGTLGDTGDDCRHPLEDVYSASVSMNGLRLVISVWAGSRGWGRHQRRRHVRAW